MAEQMTGGCACGRIRYTATVATTKPISAIAGCASGRRDRSRSPSRTVKQADVTWEHEPDWYDSSPIAARPYCRECGTSLGFIFKEGSGTWT